MSFKSLLAGIALIVLGVWLILSFFRKNKRCTSKVVGKITGVREFESTDDEGHYNGSSYEAEFAYEVNGQVYHGWGGRSYRNPDKIQIGGNIDIYYDPENPSDHYTKSGSRIVPVLIGLVLLCVGIIFVYGELIQM